MNLTQKIRTALGEEPADLLFENANLVNVLSGEIHPTAMSVRDGVIVGFNKITAKETIDLKGRFLCPGFIDGHLHLESSMLAIPEFAANVAPQGTTAVVADPHEIANVLGLEGIRYIIETAKDAAIRIYIMASSCVPATPFETSGATLNAEDMATFLDEPSVLGLAEVMNYPGVLFQDPDVLAKLRLFKGRVIDGHAPGLSGISLAAYVSAGIGSDHECAYLDEAREKLRLGMKIMIREGSAAKNLETLLPLVNEYNSRNCFFVTDDLEPNDIVERGHIVAIVRKAIRLGLHPIRAIQMAGLNTAQYFGLTTLGALAPGYAADILVLDDLERVTITQVYKAGRLVAENGRFLGLRSPSEAVKPPMSCRVDWDKVKDISVKATGGSIRVIGVVPGQIITESLVEEPKVVDSKIVSDTDRDILKMVVIERHKGTGNVGEGFIKGFGLKEGALASSVAHDSHNIIAVGVTDDDILTAAKEIVAMGGGMTVVRSGEIIARLPLPIAGLMSDQGIDEVRASLHDLSAAAKEMGCSLENPFATLSFMALTPIPKLKLTDLGLFDSEHFRFISLFADA